MIVSSFEITGEFSIVFKRTGYADVQVENPILSFKQTVEIDVGRGRTMRYLTFNDKSV